MVAVGQKFSSFDPGEARRVGFDWALNLAPSSATLPAGETLSAVTFTAALVAGNDGNPNGHWQGNPSITGSTAQQLLGPLVAGCTYKITGVATTSLGQVLPFWALVDCVSQTG